MHKRIPILQAMKIPAAKAAVNEERENLTYAVLTEQGSSASQMTAASNG